MTAISPSILVIIISSIQFEKILGGSSYKGPILEQQNLTAYLQNNISL